MVANRFQELIYVGITGFHILSMTLPVNVEEFWELVAPELRKRGMMRPEFPAGKTVREKMFLGRGPFINQRHPAYKYRNSFGEDE